ncbi:hypothetical protein DEO72_LG3g187 [Vigna unguiculata]|uniref:Uncharacterized protein n=1 Tax=Vigna unguiculata TaxID=3917 RepID=A0A4D6LAR8_VIGUN|nr:hypothetical protein DEO72_LG3g187 [Vigna unguiculata]
MAAEMITGALVSTFVQMTIDNLASRFGDLFRGDKSKKKQITKLKVKLLALDVVADDAEQKQFTNPLVRKWLLEAKDVVFDAEDLVEEINHALSKSQVEAQSHSTYTKVWNFLISCFVSSFENELIESRMEKLIQNLEHLATESHVLGLKKAHDVGVRSGWGTKLRSTYLPNEKLPDSISNLEYLRSLDLSYTSIKILTEKTCLLSYLQILKLNYCRDLEELPTNLHLLTNLCRLEFKGTKVGKVPPHLEKLKNLKVVMNFNVGHGREFGIQQLGELNLDGGVSIGELQNVENSVDALEADLKNKTHLVELELEWTRNGNSIDSEKVEDVIEKLEPPKNLKVLSIYDYAGKQFPNWLLKNSLLNLESLELCRCAPCHRLPPLGLLPLLKNLKISSCFDIVSIDADFHGNNFSSFKSLQTLYFSDMRQWEKWDCQSVTNAFPRLQHLSISYCPKLKGYLPKQLVPLETLYIIGCEQLEAAAPKALCLDLCNCGKLHLDWTTIKKLKMEETSSLEIVRSDTLKHLEIEHLEASIGDDTVSLWTFPLDFFPTLRILYLRRLGNLQMISHFGVHNYLHYLHISECPKLESFPGNIPFLKRLYIKDCPTLEAVLPSSNPFLNSALSTRWGLCGCPKLPNLREEALSQSISIFHVRGFPLVEEFSEEEGEEWEKGSSH